MSPLGQESISIAWNPFRSTKASLPSCNQTSKPSSKVSGTATAWEASWKPKISNPEEEDTNTSTNSEKRTSSPPIRNLVDLLARHSTISAQFV